jgi:hypothetical protein
MTVVEWMDTFDVKSYDWSYNEVCTFVDALFLVYESPLFLPTYQMVISDTLLAIC